MNNPFSKKKKPQPILDEPAAPASPESSHSTLKIVSFACAKAELTEQIEDVEKLRKHIESLRCPMCGNVKLSMIAHEKGFQGWEAAVMCNECLVKGVFNDSGFRIALPVHVDVKRS